MVSDATFLPGILQEVVSYASILPDRLQKVVSYATLFYQTVYMKWFMINTHTKQSIRSGL